MSRRTATARRRASQALGGVALALAVSGCGSVHYAHHARGASSRLEQAHQLEAEQFAPYEYTLARLQLDKSQEEAGNAEYGDAVALARSANEHAQKAVEVARERREQSERRSEREMDR